MEKKQIIKQTAEHIKDLMSGESSGHDWWHVYRVWNNAIFIGRQEKADMFVVELAALLHDVADWKFNNSDTSIGPRLAKEWLEKINVEENFIAQVYQIIENLSFKGSGEKNKIKTLEGMVVQDADRLDAIGAIGIARTFAYGGSRGREMYNPKIKPQKNQSFQQYKNKKSSSINHFYEKLLLLKERLNTKTAKKIAKKRHKFMKKFLEEFFQEWEGKF